MKRTTLRKKSKTPEAKLKNKLWELVKEYIKLRDGQICFTCGRYCERSGAHCGHFIPSAVGGNALRYHPMNIHRQCYHDNINLGGYGERYAEVMEQKYGRAELDKLRGLKQINSKIDYEKAIEYYKEKIANNDFKVRAEIPEFVSRL